jgi:hypothetical protein
MYKVRPAFLLALASALTLFVQPLAALSGCNECPSPGQCSFNNCVTWSDGCVTCVYTCGGDQRCTWDTCTSITMCD